MSDSKEIKFGEISLPVGSIKGPFIPTLMPYEDRANVLEVLAFAITKDMPILLIGETGVGKTSAVRHIAAKTNQNLRRVNVNGSMTAEDFIGQTLVRPGKGGGNEMFWKDGVLTEAVRKGYWVVIDEINAASAEILFALHSLMDDDKYLVLTDHPEREIVKAHPNFRLFATMNPPERYAGTKELNKALMSRFGITITVELPHEDVEFGLMSQAKDLLSPKALKALKDFIAAMRTAYQKEEMEVFISPRDTANILRVYSYTKSLMASIEKTIVPRGTRSEQKAIIDLARLHFARPKDEKKESGPKAGAAKDAAGANLATSQHQAGALASQQSASYSPKSSLSNPIPWVSRASAGVNDYVDDNGTVVKVAMLGAATPSGYHIVQTTGGWGAGTEPLVSKAKANGFVPEPSIPDQYLWRRF